MKVIVTGASQGIGAAIAEAFAAGPGELVGLWSRRSEPLEAVADRCRAQGALAEVAIVDVTVESQVADAARRWLDAHGPPDVLVNNAGRFEPGPLLEATAAHFRDQLEVNLVSAFLVTRALVPAMVEAGRGTVVFLGSVASLRAYPSGGAYSAAKHGLLGLGRSVREETRGSGVRVTTLLPGATLTPSWEGVDLPARRFMPAADIARSVVEIVALSERTVVEEILLRPADGDI